MWVSSECDLYWVSTTMCRYREFTRFDRAKSTNRYVPPNGTDGLARAAVGASGACPHLPQGRWQVLSALTYVQHRVHAAASHRPFVQQSDYGGVMRIDILSREYPPHVYGGAGVHLSLIHISEP